MTFMTKAWSVLHILLVLGVQFAPVVHDAIPHREETNSCTHSDRSLHLEHDESHPNAAPCFFCAHDGGRSVAVLPAFESADAVVALRAPTIPEAGDPGLSPLLLPDSRGPP